VLAKIDAATREGGTFVFGPIDFTERTFDLRWAMQHASAAAACAASSPVSDSSFEHVVIAKPRGVTCAAACLGNTQGTWTACRTSIAVGSIRLTQATAPTDILAKNYNYSCADGQALFDEVAGDGLDSSYSAYCCCYRPLT
jgi:hypothetical protein